MGNDMEKRPGNSRENAPVPALRGQPEKDPENDLKKSVFSGMFWRFGERITAQLVTLVVETVLARLLMPEAYSAIAIVLVFITFANVFVTSGFGNSLIQKKDAGSVDFSSVFYFNLALSAMLYLILFAVAPAIESFYGMEKYHLATVIRVFAVRIPVAAINSVQQAYVARQMIFRKFFVATLFGTVLSAGVGIVLAYYFVEFRGQPELGVWALVAQYLTNTTVDTIVLWFTLKWRPTLEFSWKRLRGLLSFGWKLLAASLIDTGYNELRNLIIGKMTMKEGADGKMHESADLGYYTNGKKYPQYLATNINVAVSSVLFPVISRYQDDREKVRQMTRRAIRVSTYVMCPLMMGLAAVSFPLVSLLLTDKWLPAIPYWCICCFTYAFWPIHTANLEALKAVGRSDLYLLLEIIKKSIGLALLLGVTFLVPKDFCYILPVGVTEIRITYVFLIAFTGVITTITSCVVNAFPNRKILGYGFGAQIRDMLPGIGMSVLMGAAVLSLHYLVPFPNHWVELLVEVVAGTAVYIGLSLLFRSESFFYLLRTVKSFLHGRKSAPVSTAESAVPAEVGATAKTGKTEDAATTVEPVKPAEKGTETASKRGEDPEDK